MTDIGRIWRWRDGDILWSENDFCRMAYLATDDERLVGTIAEHKGIYVEMITPEQASKWDGCPGQIELTAQRTT